MDARGLDLGLGAFVEEHATHVQKAVVYYYRYLLPLLLLLLLLLLLYATPYRRMLQDGEHTMTRRSFWRHASLQYAFVYVCLVTLSACVYMCPSKKTHDC